MDSSFIKKHVSNNSKGIDSYKFQQYDTIYNTL